MKKPNAETAAKLINLKKCRYTKDGREILNPKPRLALVGPAKPLSDIEKMDKMVKADRMIEAMEKYTETWEESNDFNIDDEVDEEHFNTHFTLMEDELPETALEISPESQKIANDLLNLADKIQNGELDPNKIKIATESDSEDSEATDVLNENDSQ